MNIFATSACPVQSAQDHCTVHNIKMILEAAQLLSVAHFELDGQQVGYKPTHKNHPSAVWARNCSANYEWLLAHFIALCKEYTFRTGKIHKTESLVDTLSVQPTNIRQGGLETFAMCMPDEYKAKGIFDPTKAYQAYLNDKFAEWTCRAKPIKVEWANRKQPKWALLG